MSFHNLRHAVANGGAARQHKLAEAFQLHDRRIELLAAGEGTDDVLFQHGDVWSPSGARRWPW